MPDERFAEKKKPVFDRSVAAPGSYHFALRIWTQFIVRARVHNFCMFLHCQIFIKSKLDLDIFEELAPDPERLLSIRLRIRIYKKKVRIRIHIIKRSQIRIWKVVGSGLNIYIQNPSRIML